MKTTHKIIIGNSKNMTRKESVDLIITSPPYPMIDMWDELFIRQNPDIKKFLKSGDGNMSFNFMHRELVKTWKRTCDALKPGGIICINIGDATRTTGGVFKLYSNHSRITEEFLKLRFDALPAIIWRKQTNAPNKFLGSGMLPPNAYVTLEHEFILIFRKIANKNTKCKKEKTNRQQSAIFWEERNNWFSDVWFDLKGEKQDLLDSKTRKRSAAFPFELAFRLINMYSVKKDTVLDPFIGTATTTIAAIASCRNSIGYEIEPGFENLIKKRILLSKDFCNNYNFNRITKHLEFTKKRSINNKDMKYKNKYHNFPVVTRQEINLLINKIIDIHKKSDNLFEVLYENKPLARK